MKGFTHFVSGIAVATFFPQAVHMATQEQSFILCLGGIFGILPDTLDFKFARYFHRSEFEVRPDPENLDAALIASTVAAALTKARETGRSTVQLHTMQLGANVWRSYSLFFDQQKQDVVVELGPLVDTGQIPFEGTEPLERRAAAVHVDCPFFQPFDKKSTIAIMSGPSFEFVKRPDGRIEIVFLPWHRTWSHSLSLGALLAAVVGVIAFLTVPEGLHPELYSIPRWMLYPLIVFCGSLVHILEDSTGYMGNSLFYPATRDRTNGLGWMSAAEGIPNVSVVWIAFMAILFNLDRFRWAPEVNVPGIPHVGAFLFWFLAVPSVLMLFFFLRGKRRKEVTESREPDFDGPGERGETDASVL